MRFTAKDATSFIDGQRRLGGDAQSPLRYARLKCTGLVACLGRSTRRRACPSCGSAKLPSQSTQTVAEADAVHAYVIDTPGKLQKTNKRPAHAKPEKKCRAFTAEAGPYYVNDREGPADLNYRDNCHATFCGAHRAGSRRSGAALLCRRLSGRGSATDA